FPHANETRSCCSPSGSDHHELTDAGTDAPAPPQPPAAVPRPAGPARSRTRRTAPRASTSDWPAPVPGSPPPPPPAGRTTTPTAPVPPRPPRSGPHARDPPAARSVSSVSPLTQCTALVRRTQPSSVDRETPELAMLQAQRVLHVGGADRRAVLGGG